MKTNFCILLLLLLSFNGLTQTFALKHGKRKRTYTVAEKYADSIRLDIYTLEPDFTQLESSSLLLRGNKENQQYNSKKIIANQTEEFLFISFSDTTNGKEKYELKLFPADPNLSNILKKGCHYSEKNKQLELLEDSLTCAANTESIALLFNDDRVAYDSIPYTVYARTVDYISDSLAKAYSSRSTMVVGSYYQAIRTMKTMDIKQVTALLDDADFDYNYSNRFLEALACEQTSLLIQYVDNKNNCENEVLKAIRKSENFQEIIGHVKSIEGPDSYGKTEIIKQEKERKKKLIAKRSLQALIVTGQAALTIGMLIWIL